MVAEILCHGRENAMRGADLCRMLNISSLARLQKQISRERQSGKLILSDSTGAKGYYLPSCDPEVAAEEIAHFVRMMSSRANRIRQAMRAAQTALNDLGQTKIEI